MAARTPAAPHCAAAGSSCRLLAGLAERRSQWYVLDVNVSLAADQVRALLRSAGFMECEPGRRGFLVEGDPEGGWVSVACQQGLPWAKARRNRDLRKYRDILLAAGFTVRDSPWLKGVLRVTLPPDAEA